ncbi:MAG: pilus assembly protein N-terminal domain-containing protein [Pirellulales bacterium]|nr:pilus assembly protein N-terminal domain-containing protein [Pirellulales bacterium]
MTAARAGKASCKITNLCRALAPAIAFGVLVAASSLARGQVRDLPIPDPDQRLNNPPPSVRQRMDNLVLPDVPYDAIIRLGQRRTKLFRTKQPVGRIAITDPNIVEVIQYGPTEFEFVGNTSGETSLTMWFAGVDGQQTILRFVVKVEADSQEQEQAEIEYARLEARLNELFPNSRIQLIPVLDKLIVRGQARDAEEADQIISILTGQQVNQTGTPFVGAVGALGGGAGPNRGAVAAIPGVDLPTEDVISLLEVPGEHQVMLKVRIAEIKRSALRDFGFDFSIAEDNFSIGPVLSGAGNLTAILDGGDVTLFLRAFASNNMGKILAEPTLVALSGRTATFLAGGEFPVPTAVGIGGIGAASTAFRGFGTQLAFTPTVLDKDRIRLQVTPSFSNVNANNSVGGIFGLDTRAVATTVDLREGQWLAIAGLIQDQQSGQNTRIPYAGTIPLIGTLFRNQQTQRDETELVVLVSPELVHPLDAKQVPLLLPGMDVTEPTNEELYWHGQIEGDPNVHHRSTVWHNYHHRMQHAQRDALRMAKQQARFERNQSYYINGPHGFSK